MIISPTLHHILITSPTSSTTNSFLLLHCTPSDPSEPLNLTLRATEGTTPFFAKIRRSKLLTYRNRNYGGTELELENVFMRLLLRQKVDGVGLYGVELSASVSDEAAFITIRQRIGGILKGIADIKIPVKMDEEMDPFEWAAGSCLELDTALADLETANEQVAAQKAEVEKMKSLFNDLEALKKEHEETMLIKFRDLLNSKKKKIRELQKELEEARGNATQAFVDRSKTEASQSPEPAPRRKAGATKKSTPTTATRVTRSAATARKRKPTASPTEKTDSEDEFAANSPSPPRRRAARRMGACGARKTRGSAMTTTRTMRKSPELLSIVKKEDDDDDRTASETDETADEDAQLSDAGQRESEDEMPPPRKPAAFFQGRKPVEGEGAKKLNLEPMEWDPSTMTTGVGWDAGDETEDDEL